MSDPALLDATQVDPKMLDAFLRRVYPQPRCDFLNEHGGWWHRSDVHRLVVQVNEKIAGYCAVIPTNIWVGGRVRPALWWVHLVIAPEFRGQGLQKLLDHRVRGMADLLLGFPNKLAGIIHRKHGWGVREDAQVLLLPLFPSHVRIVQNSSGTRRKVVTGWSACTGSTCRGLAGMVLIKSGGPLQRHGSLDASILSNIFQQALTERLNTTWRDGSYFEWRYKNAPQPEEYSYYLAGTPSPTHYLISRHMMQPDGLFCTRILDLFGKLDDSTAIHDLLTLVVQDAIIHGSRQVTLVSSHSVIKQVARQLGFLLSAPFGFCWWSTSSELMTAFAGENYWTLGDSDNDAPD